MQPSVIVTKVARLSEAVPVIVTATRHDDGRYGTRSRDRRGEPKGIPEILRVLFARTSIYVYTVSKVTRHPLRVVRRLASRPASLRPTSVAPTLPLGFDSLPYNGGLWTESGPTGIVVERISIRFVNRNKFRPTLRTDKPGRGLIARLDNLQLTTRKFSEYFPRGLRFCCVGCIKPASCRAA